MKDLQKKSFSIDKDEMTDIDVCRAIIALANAVLLENGKDIKFKMTNNEHKKEKNDRECNGAP